MKSYITVLSAMFLLATGASAQRTTGQIVSDAADQLRYQASRIPEDGKFPRTLVTDYSIPEVAYHLERAPKDFYPETGMAKHPSVKDFNTVAYVNYHDWTSGFYPGSLWLAYEMTGNEDLRDLAARYTNQLLPVSRKKDTHDLGFMVNCSFGNALRLAPDDSIKNVIVATADNLIGRFDPKVGLIRSWDWGKWNYPVIIDNMMNLQLLFNASKLTGDPKYRDIAVKHADKTMRNHFRSDYSSYHVVSYTPDGRVESRGTYQGKSHDSAWSRGQAWGLYGYTECYRETGDKRYLDQARNIASLIMRKNQAPDRVPYWDLDARNAADSPRDASAGAICASALIELSTFVPEWEGKIYRDYAMQILDALSSDKYTATKCANGGFILMHSTGSMPQGSEIDTPLNYADYYYLESLARLKRIQDGKTPGDWDRIAGKKIRKSKKSK